MLCILVFVQIRRHAIKELPRFATGENIVRVADILTQLLQTGIKCPKMNTEETFMSFLENVFIVLGKNPSTWVVYTINIIMFMSVMAMICCEYFNVFSVRTSPWFSSNI